jgi:hypothetical protein
MGRRWEEDGKKMGRRWEEDGKKMGRRWERKRKWISFGLKLYLCESKLINKTVNDLPTTDKEAKKKAKEEARLKKKEEKEKKKEEKKRILEKKREEKLQVDCGCVRVVILEDISSHQ